MNLSQRIAGRVLIRVTGAYPEDFLSGLAQRNITFRSLRWEDALTITLVIYAGDLSSVRQCAQKTMCSLDILESMGIIPHLRMLGLRLGYVGVLLGLIILVFCLQGHIWFLSVSGNTTIPTERICQTLEAYGIGFWTAKRSLDLNTIKNQVLAEIPELSWLTINTEGGFAEVIVRERNIKPVISKQSAPANVVAGKGGMITAMTVTAGTAAVQPGDVVQPGDLLISGVTDLDKTLLITRATGEVRARTWNRMQVILPDNQMLKEYTGRESVRYSLTLGKKTINFYKTSGISYAEYDKIIENTVLTLPGGFSFPVTVSKMVFREYNSAPSTVDDDMRQALMESAAERQLRTSLQAGTVINTRWSTQDSGEGFVLSGIAECQEEIGITKEIGD